MVVIAGALTMAAAGAATARPVPHASASGTALPDTAARPAAKIALIC